MHNLPHRYSVNALAAPSGVVTVRGAELEDIQSTAPVEFDGPPGNWSPETLFVASIADCFVLSFRRIARDSKLEWIEIDCAAEGTLENTADGLAFTRIDLHVALRVPAGRDPGRAQRLLEKAEKNCVVANSIKPGVHLLSRVSEG